MAEDDVKLPAKITRSARGLVDALFNTIDRLNAREIDSEHARAVSHTAKSIVAVARLELDHKRYEADVGKTSITSLQIESK
jgi:hypothetical protein